MLCSHKVNGDPLIDGDQITAIFRKSETYHGLFMPMLPTYTFIDRANGRYNRNMDFKKDYAAILSAAYDIDRAYDHYLNNPEEDSYEVMHHLGLDLEDSQESIEQRERLIRKLANGEIEGSFRDRFCGWLDLD